MRLKSFEQWHLSPAVCTSCGEEHWGDTDRCDDCKDADLEPTAEPKPEPRTREPRLPRFGVPTTKSQNIYYL